MLLELLAVAAGSVLVLTALVSAVRTVVVPRGLPSLLTRVVFSVVRRLLDLLARPLRGRRHDDLRAAYAPLALVTLPAAWLGLVALGFTLIYWGIGVGSFVVSFETSGSSLLTLGFLRPEGAGAITLTFVEAAIGLGLVALLISYLPTIYGAFNRRETLVGMLEVRAGLPPSPSVLLARYYRTGLFAVIDDELFARWETWFADVEETHSSFPALAFFRSQEPGRSWVTAAGCVLDTAALYLAALDGVRSPIGAVMIRNGFFALRRIAGLHGIEYDADPAPTDPISITRRELDDLLDELAREGIAVRTDRDQIWRDFAGWRVNYDTVLVGLAQLVEAPPARWSSDRTTVSPPSRGRTAKAPVKPTPPTGPERTPPP